LNFLKRCKSHSSLWNATILFVLVSGFLIAVDQISMRFGLHGYQRIADDLLGGLISASIFHLYERQRLRRLREHLHLIDLMNHHIRNALQPLVFVAQEAETKMQMNVVEDCVHRIDWALREVLPGKSGAQFVVHTRGSAGGSAVPARSRDASLSPAIQYSRPRPAGSQPPPFFSRWIDSWRGRNEKAS
jgi:uncharacterized membrane protein